MSYLAFLPSIESDEYHLAIGYWHLNLLVLFTFLSKLTSIICLDKSYTVFTKVFARGRLV